MRKQTEVTLCTIYIMRSHMYRVLAFQVNMAGREGSVSDAVYAAVVQYITINGRMTMFEHTAQSEGKTVVRSVKDNGKRNGPLAKKVKLIRIRDVIERSGYRVILRFGAMSTAVVFSVVVTAMVMVIMIVLSKDKSSA